MADHQPIEEQHRNTMNAVAAVLADTFPGVGFCLLVFEFGARGRMNYISNAGRDDMALALREILAKHEGRAAHTDLLNALEQALILAEGTADNSTVRLTLKQALATVAQLREAWQVTP
jgi:hypothetical protein